jgi:preprotein translocase subunit SecE
MRRISDLSIEDNAAPKRRSSAANRRRSRRGGTQRAVSTESQSIQQSNVATAEDVTPAAKASRLVRRRSAEAEEVSVDATEASAAQDTMDKNARRREERRRAKQQAPARSGVGRVVNTERMSGVRKFYNDTASEIRKVVWPDRETTRNLTIVVIAMSTLMGFLLGGIDFVLFRLFEAIT